MVEKNLKKAKAKKNRVLVGFNTGVRTFKTEKNPSRAMNKKNFQKMLDNY